MRNEKKSSKKWIILLLLFLLCFLAGFYYLYSNNSKNDFREETSAIGYTTKIQKPKNFKNQIALPGFSKIKVKKGDSYAKVALSNPSFNEVYFKYTVKMKENNKILLTTDAIPPGKAVQGFKIPKDLAVGEYEIVIAIKTYDKKTKAVLNGGTGITKLIVEER